MGSTRISVQLIQTATKTVGGEEERSAKSEQGRDGEGEMGRGEEERPHDRHNTAILASGDKSRQEQSGIRPLARRVAYPRR